MTANENEGLGRKTRALRGALLSSVVFGVFIPLNSCGESDTGSNKNDAGSPRKMAALGEAPALTAAGRTGEGLSGQPSLARNQKQAGSLKEEHPFALILGAVGDQPAGEIKSRIKSFSPPIAVASRVENTAMRKPAGAIKPAQIALLQGQDEPVLGDPLSTGPLPNNQMAALDSPTLLARGGGVLSLGLPQETLPIIGSIAPSSAVDLSETLLPVAASFVAPRVVIEALSAEREATGANKSEREDVIGAFVGAHSSSALAEEQLSGAGLSQNRLASENQAQTGDLASSVLALTSDDLGSASIATNASQTSIFAPDHAPNSSGNSDFGLTAITGLAIEATGIFTAKARPSTRKTDPEPQNAQLVAPTIAPSGEPLLIGAVGGVGGEDIGTGQATPKTTTDARPILPLPTFEQGGLTSAPEAATDLALAPVQVQPMNEFRPMNGFSAEPSGLFPKDGAVQTVLPAVEVDHLTPIAGEALTRQDVGASFVAKAAGVDALIGEAKVGGAGAGAGAPSLAIAQPDLGLGSDLSPTAGQVSPIAATAQGSQLAQGPNLQDFMPAASAPVLSYDDELILEVRVPNISTRDTMIAYGTRQGIYLPLGELARYLDLAIVVSNEGTYASGWFLSEDRTLMIDLQQMTLTKNGQEEPLAPADVVDFEGEMYVRSDVYSDLLPITIEPNLRNQSILITTLEPFPFEERMAREAARLQLESRGERRAERRWPREETPWSAFSIPSGDLELRAESDSALGSRLESDLYLAGDIAFLSAEAFLSGTTRDGLTSARLGLGRRDPDAELLGPLKASEFQIGDVGGLSMPIGLRGTSGRGVSITNTPLETVSVFDTVDLRGQLPEGYEVELFRNDILVGSTRDSVNGQYEFLQTRVEYGLNVFRLIFHGPQGQQREETRQISVGSGRLPKGKFVYQLGVAQKDVNLLGVRTPDFVAQQDYRSWRGNGQLSYGLTSQITGTLAGAWFDSDDGEHWITSAGLRTAIGKIAIKADLAMADRGAGAAGIGINAQLFGSAATLTHYEYKGDFVDEIRSFGSDYLNRATELDLNANLRLGALGQAVIPISIRARRVEFTDGRSQLRAGLRGSYRSSGLLFSNALEYSKNVSSGGFSRSELNGNFDLASLNSSQFKMRVGLGYQIVPNISFDLATVELDYALDRKTLVHGSLGYGFKSSDTQFGLSAVREFDNFTLALDGSYAPKQNAYSVALRLGFSFGRNPQNTRLFMGPPGYASGGAIAVRAFRDLNGNLDYDEGDEVLPDITFSSAHQIAETDDNGQAILGGLGSGNRVSIRVDTSSLPDIFMAPVSGGIEIVPRPGRIHSSDFAIVGLSEIEGVAKFENDGRNRGVSGVRLELVNKDGEKKSLLRTEADGYFFFEEVFPGDYQIMLDEEQSERLNICLSAPVIVAIGPLSDIVTRNFSIISCKDASQEE